MQQICSVEDFLVLENEIARHRMSGIRFLYRGQSDATWQLQTTLYRTLRNTYTDDTVWAKYLDCYNTLKNYSVSHGVLDYMPKNENEDFFILSMARHLEFPCHLLDWSASLRKALLFACTENNDTDGALWMLSTRTMFNASPIEISPFEIDSPLLICKEFDLIPSYKSILSFPLGRLRRFRQNGFMSIIPRTHLSKDFKTILSPDHSLSKITIAANAKKPILSYLQQNGESLDYVMAYYDDSKNDRMWRIVLDLTDELNNK